MSLLAHSGPAARADECPLSEVKRTLRERRVISAHDPKRTFHTLIRHARVFIPISGRITLGLLLPSRAILTDVCARDRLSRDAIQHFHPTSAVCWANFCLPHRRQ